MIPGTTIDGLLSEAGERWHDIFDAEALRMQVMLICPRKERKILEMHGDMVEHGQPVIGVFHRPRAEAHLLEEQGLNPRDASFEFLDLATTDLGPWMQHMIANEKWVRGSISIQPVPFSVDVPAQRAFENITMICFRHPSLPAIERYYLPFPPTSIPNKCFVSLPRRQAAELARQQAEILGVGRAAERATPEPVHVEEQVHVAPVPVQAPQTNTVEAAEVSIPDQESVPLPTIETESPEGPQSVTEAITKATTDGFEEMQAAGDELEETNVPMPTTDNSNEVVEAIPEQIEEPQTEIEIEFRALVTELMANGVEPSDMVDDPRWEPINERAAAVGFETWPVFMELTSVQ